MAARPKHTHNPHNVYGGFLSWLRPLQSAARSIFAVAVCFLLFWALRAFNHLLNNKHWESQPSFDAGAFNVWLLCVCVDVCVCALCALQCMAVGRSGMHVVAVLV